MTFQKLICRWLIPNKFYGGALREEAGYCLCKVEFDDQGELWDPEQLEGTIAHIQNKCHNRPGGRKKSSSVAEVIVITFMHGWMHNASPGDRNLEAFEKLLRKRAKAEAFFAEQNDRWPRLIIGVYFAWRGLLLKLPLIRYFTFWSRKMAALRVGQLSSTEAIFRIIGAVKSRNNRSQCIFIGHSFGGLIMENAICKALLGAILQNEGNSRDSPSDLVVLVNPACEAAGAKQFIDILERNKVCVQMGEATTKQGLPFPMLVSITSVGDFPTKYAFPLGQRLVNWPKAFRSYNQPPKGLPSQKYLHRHTAGHIPFFHNFELKPVQNREVDSEKLEFSFKHGEHKFQIVPKACTYASPHFWLMQVPKEIVPNHSDVFTEGLDNMLSALLHWVTTSVEPTKLDCSSSKQSELKGKVREYIDSSAQSKN